MSTKGGTWAGVHYSLSTPWTIDPTSTRVAYKHAPERRTKQCFLKEMGHQFRRYSMALLDEGGLELPSCILMFSNTTTHQYDH